MPVRVLQINFKYSAPSEELKSTFAPLVKDIAATPGLRWKIWIMNEQERQAGGIYLFDDEGSVREYLEGPIVAGLKTHPALKEISAKEFEVIGDFTTATRGPMKGSV